MRLLKTFSIGACVLGLVNALPRRATDTAKHDVSELRDEYDFVIVGAGTAGLTVADRLSAAFPDRTVLVIEYGKIEKAVGYYDPKEDGTGVSRLVISSPPIESLNNRSAIVILGMTVGGSSAANGQFFDRGSKFDYNEWATLGSPGWDWNSLYPSFKKSSYLTAPSKEHVAQYGYTYDPASYGGDSIEASFPPFQWPIQKPGWEGFVDMGLETPRDCANGNKHGVCWVPTAQNSQNVERSHAGVGHYTRIAATRPNLDLLVEHKVTRLVINNRKSVPSVEFRSRAGGPLRTIRPKREVIISAGAIHTPQILQRSGVADAKFLQSAGIKVVNDLPGVGRNFQDHCGVPITFKHDELHPSEADVTNNATFAAEAVAQFRERPARGPYTLAMGNSAAYVSLPNITPEARTIVANIRKQIKNRTALKYLPAGTPTTVQAGYLAQLEIIAKALENRKHPILEVPFAVAPSTAFLLKPLSRGTVMIDPNNHDATPIVNYNTASNPIDLDIMVSYVDYFRRLYSTPTWKSYNAVEVAPGADVTEKDAIIEYLRQTVIQSLMHPCCTAAMLPKSKGGVVNSKLQVYDLTGVRVADNSIIPVLPAAHTTTTAYAIGEKAATMIISQWKGKF
ncbi:related to alcohol oxidase [Cephalotrichum gorgonifer]|uniref:Related to alcohol oxidase n=1 Tax=Cephalotrichum gorgonifer TaxID=2041049 RepID=A0AAE8SZK6_9PEZI|nr:related to alcohol oxidase [Cephalotrichum gorgonifer]